MAKKVANEVLISQDKPGMLQRALERIVELYTDKSHFVYELIQNAEDAGATKIKFEQYENELVVQHDGRPFSLQNLKALCDIGMSDKGGDLNKIGEFGVGFKSVYGICETVRLYSYPSIEDEKNGFEPYAVQIRDFTTLEDIEDCEMEEGYTTKFVFPYKIGLTYTSFTSIKSLNDALTKRLKNMGITTLLFMKNLQSIQYVIQRKNVHLSGMYRLNRVKIRKDCFFVSSIGSTEGDTSVKENSYLVFSQPVTRNSIKRSVDIAYAVDVKESGEYEFKSAKSPYISVYFPTETESKLKFIVQGPYRTTPNRSSVPADDKDNVYFAARTAKLFRTSVIQLQKMNKINLSFLNILPLNKEVFENAPLFECLFEETKQLLLNENLLPCMDGSLASAQSIKIARSPDITKVFTAELISELLNDGKQYRWLISSITGNAKKYKELYEYLTKELDIEVIRLEHLRNAFIKNPSFMYNRDTNWLLKFYKMYELVGAAFEKRNAGSNMLTAPIIKTKSGKFVPAYREQDNGKPQKGKRHKKEDIVYVPNIYLLEKGAGKIAGVEYVNPVIARGCPTFFQDVLGLRPPNLFEFFIADFKRRYSSGVKITEVQHIDDLKNLYILLNNESVNNKGRLIELMQLYLKLRCTIDDQTVYLNPFQEQTYFSITSENMNIKEYYQNIKIVPYVDLDFYKNNGISYGILKEFGVLDSIAVGTHTKGKEPLIRQGWPDQWIAVDDFLLKLSIDELNKVLKYISDNWSSPNAKSKSKFIFQFLQNNEEHLFGKVNVLGRGEIERYSDIVVRLRRDQTINLVFGDTWNGKWLFTNSGKIVSQKQITKFNLDTQLYGEIKTESKLYQYLGFQKTKEEQLKEKAPEYYELDVKTRDELFAAELQKRFNISISDLEQQKDRIVKEALVQKEEADQFDFPSKPVRNWGSLKKHAAQALVYAIPVEYQERIRRVRTSQSDIEIRTYLKDMYGIVGSNQCFCQSCHKPTSHFEKCQVSSTMAKELEAMYLCMCPNCARTYQLGRNYEPNVHKLIAAIHDLSDAAIDSQNPVRIKFAGRELWFTQTHIAEIRELIRLSQIINISEEDF